jgi:hypothetical protein
MSANKISSLFSVKDIYGVGKEDLFFNPYIKSTDERAKKKLALYYRNRAKQILFRGWDWDGNITYHEWGCETRITFRFTKDEAASAIVYQDYKGRGIYKNWVKSLDVPLVYFYECNEVSSFVSVKKDEKFFNIAKGSVKIAQNATIFNRNYDYEYYGNGFISDDTYIALDIAYYFYLNKNAKRSGLPYIFHIWEGIRILQELGADEKTIAAWCIHPLVQSDEDFDREMNSHCLISNFVSGQVLFLALEYRHWANSHLSHMPSKIPSFGHRDEIRKMLIADKVQNRKDFEKHLKGREDVKSFTLDSYYKEWFKALGIFESQYTELAKLIY